MGAAAGGLCLVLAWSACNDLSVGGAPYLVLAPVLDSLFVGDQAARPSVTYYDGNGGSRTPASSEVTWASSDTAVLGVDSVTGRLTARRRGIAGIVATVQNVQGVALVVVSNTLDLTLLLDTIYAWPGDTLPVPVAVKKLNNPPPVVWWEAPPGTGVYAIDSASGRLRALTAGGPVRYIVHADTIADTGAVQVLTLGDTTGGKMFFSVVGTAVAHAGGPATGANYRRSGGSLAFRLTGTHPGATSRLTVEITFPDALAAAGTYAVDSLGAAEAGALLATSPPFCAPPRPWALWSSLTPSIIALSHASGTLVVARIVPVTGGQAISGWFAYTAQRTDLYRDPLGLLTIHGTFVAPLITDQTICR